MADKLIDAYPQSIGSRILSIADHFGPASYPTGGEVVQPISLGMSVFDWVTFPIPAFVLSGNYAVQVTYQSLPGTPVPTVKFMWFSIATGSEVVNGTNLSGEVIRVQAIGA